VLTRLLFAENIWDGEKQRARAHLVYNCGRADDPASTQRLRCPAKSILRSCAPKEIVAERRLAAAECLDWSVRRIRPRYALDNSEVKVSRRLSARSLAKGKWISARA
jgi:hypothetical protein